jgi:hypothetical protein
VIRRLIEAIATTILTEKPPFTTINKDEGGGSAKVT